MCQELVSYDLINCSEFLGRAINLKPENGRRRTRLRPSKRVSLKWFNPKGQAGSTLKGGTTSPVWTSRCITNQQHSKSFTVRSGSEIFPFCLFICTTWDFYNVWERAQKRSVALQTFDLLFPLFPFKGCCESLKWRQKRNREESESIHQAPSSGSCIPSARAMNNIPCATQQKELAQQELPKRIN